MGTEDADDMSTVEGKLREEVEKGDSNHSSEESRKFKHSRS